MRFTTTVLLWVLTTVALAIAVPTAWAQLNVVDVDGYAAMAREAASEPVVQSASASALATQATALINKRGYRVDPGLVRSVAGAYTASPAFPDQFADLNRVVHGWLFDPDGSFGVVDVGPMLNDPALAQRLRGYHVRLPANSTVPVPVSSRPLNNDRLQLFARWNLVVSLLASTVAAGCAVLTLVVARRRGRALSSLGVAALLAGACGWAAVEVARHRIDDVLGDADGDVRAVAAAMVDHAESSLHRWLDLTLAAGGVLVLTGVVVAMLGALRASRRSRLP